jgi:uncharacterized Tic20 family protein
MATEAYAGPLKDVDKQIGMMCHMSGMIGLIAGGLATPLGPFLIWQQKRTQSPFIDYHGKEALNFQLNILVVMVILILLALLSATDILFLLPLAGGLYCVVNSVIAGMRANEGIMYRYPVTIRLIK